jgi:hypothetical protein
MEIMAKDSGQGTRKAMYALFIFVLVIPLLLILISFPITPTILFVSGAAELAFGFYAFTTGNATNSIAPTYHDKNKKEEVETKAKEIIRAGRLITIGAILVLIAGLLYDCLAMANPLHVTFSFIVLVISIILVSVGALKLKRYVSFEL